MISVQTVPLFNINSVPKLGVVVITKTWLFVVSGVASNRTLVMEYILPIVRLRGARLMPCFL